MASFGSSARLHIYAAILYAFLGNTALTVGVVFAIVVGNNGIGLTPPPAELRDDAAAVAVAALVFPAGTLNISRPFSKV